jgi:hypothetical protein
MRFIANFILFGILFYLIYLFFPDAFFTLVSWANATYAFLRNLGIQLVERFQAWREGGASPNAPTHAQTMMLIYGQLIERLVCS